MKKIILFFLCALPAIKAAAQTVGLSEDFESYQGFGSSLTNGWTSSLSGFKVYLRSINGANNKICETALTNNHRKDSLTTPDLNLPTGSAVLNFRSRIVDSYTGNTAFFSHTPASDDELNAFLSLDGGNFQQVLNLLPSYPTNSAGLEFTNFSIPINASAGSVAKVKLIANAKPGTEWYPSFDDFQLIINSDPTSSKRTLKKDQGIQIIPNPASHRITIQSPGFGSRAELEIFNILGNLVFCSEISTGKCLVDVSNFRSGIYLVKVTEGNKSQYERLIVRQ